MSTLHLFHVESLESKFQGLLHIQGEIENKQSNMKTNLATLKELYTNLVKQNNKKIFLFCLDSFYFQYKTLSVELDNIERFITMINNRMYGDYYKLYNIILMETSQNDSDVQSLLQEFKNFTPYKDLDPFHNYQKDEMISLHKHILTLLNHLQLKSLKKEQEIVDYGEMTTLGMGVGNFMQTLSYHNTLTKEQMGLYVNYLQFFHKSQEGYLTKLFIRIEGFLKEVEEDILHHRGGQTTQMTIQSPLHKELQEEKEAKKQDLKENIQLLENNIEVQIQEKEQKKGKVVNIKAVKKENPKKDEKEETETQEDIEEPKKDAKQKKNDDKNKNDDKEQKK